MWASFFVLGVMDILTTMLCASAPSKKKIKRKPQKIWVGSGMDIYGVRIAPEPVELTSDNWEPPKQLRSPLSTIKNLKGSLNLCILQRRKDLIWSHTDSEWAPGRTRAWFQIFQLTEQSLWLLFLLSCRCFFKILNNNKESQCMQRSTVPVDPGTFWCFPYVSCLDFHTSLGTFLHNAVSYLQKPMKLLTFLAGCKRCSLDMFPSGL